MHIKSYFYPIIFVLLTSYLVLIGCTQEPEGDIKIGTTVSLEGKYLRLSFEQLNGLKLWVEETNQNGGILGRKIDLIFYDDKSDPDESAKQFRRLILEDRVDVLVSPYSSPMTIKASEISEELSVPMIVVGASATEIWRRGFKNVFGMYTPAVRYMDGVIEYAANIGIDKVALIYDDSVYGADLAAGVRNKTRSENINLTMDSSFKKNGGNFEELIKGVKSSKAEMLIAGTYLDDSVEIVEEAYRQKYIPQIMIFSVGPGLPDFGAKLLEKAEGIMGNSQWEITLPIKGINEFSKKYEETYGYKPGYHAAGGFGAGQLIQIIINKNRSTDKSKFAKSAHKLKSQTIFGKYSVDESGMQVGKPGYTIQWFGKKREIVLPEEIASRELVTPLHQAINR